MFSATQRSGRIGRLLQSHWNQVQSRVCFGFFRDKFKNIIQNMPEPEISKLKSGLTVVTEFRDTTHSCVGLYCEAGSRFEASRFENGMGHFFEHMFYQGTEERSKSCLQELMTCTGARFRSFTSRDINGYYALCLSTDTPLIIDILGDCLFKNLYDDAEIEKQKEVVLSEFERRDQDPNDVLFDYLHAVAFEATPLGQTVLGSTINLMRFKSSNIKNYIARMCVPSRVYLVYVGPLSHECIVSAAPKFTSPCEPCIAPHVTVRYSGGDFRYRDDSLPYANCVIAFESTNACDTDSYILDVAAAHLGGWDFAQNGTRDNAHILAQAAHAHHLVAYQAFNIKYRDCGLWGIQFMGDKMHLDDMVYNIQTQFMKLCTCITDKELEKAKREIKTQLLTHLESAENACHDLARWVVLNGARPPLRVRLNMIENVSASEVQEVCDYFLWDKDPVVAAVGPCECLPDYARIRAGQYWLRF